MFKEKISDKLRIEANQRTKERNYWLNKLSGELVSTHFHHDHFTTAPGIPAEGEPPHQGQSLPADAAVGTTTAINFGFEEELGRRLEKLSGGADFRLHMILVAGLTALLHKYTDQTDIITGSPIYKQEVNIEFINTVLPLRIRCHGDMTFKNLLLQVRETVFEAVENQNYPMEILVEKLEEGASLSHFSLFDTAILVQTVHDKSYLRHLRLNMIFSFLKTSGHIEGTIEYNPRLYEKQTIEQISMHFCQFFRKALFDVDGRIADIDILPLEEKRRLLVQFNNNAADFPQNKTPVQFLEDHARQNPDRVAVSFMEHDLTYRHLNQRANRLGGGLRENGIGCDQLVGILMDRSPLMMESILATWKAGGAYIPLGTEYPWERLLLILRDSGAGVLLTSSIDANPRWGEGYQGKMIQPDKMNKGNREAEPNGKEAANPDLEINTNNLAYIIYTSGSTGTPKGAMVEHIGMMNHIQAKINDLDLTGKSVIAQNANHTFDISVWQFFAPLVVGGKTVIYPHDLILDTEKLMSQLNADGVTVLEVVPSYLSVILDFFARRTSPLFLSLEYLMVTGEELKPHLAEKWFEKCPGIKLINAYGPTEASDDITHHMMEQLPETDAKIGRVPIGKPLQNLNIYIVDASMNLCPIGVKGEICVSGPGVGRGYLNHVEKIRQVFIEDPFREKTGVRFYRTGDLGQWRADGLIDFWGRKDYQVKIRGFRIELGEIESLLSQHPHIKHAVVIDKKDQWGNKYLCAYFVPPHADENRESGEPSHMKLKEYLLEKLPDYMVPAHFVKLERIPLTANGKVDRKVLPEPVENKKSITPPTNRLEKKILEVWAEVLALDRGKIGIDDNFFELGGHSLNAMLLISKIHQQLNIKVPLAKVFHFQTIRELAAFIEKTAKDEFISIAPVEKSEYYQVSSAQKRLYILQKMNLENTAYNILETYELGRIANREKLADTFKKLIARHESLRTSFHMVDDQPFQEIHPLVEFEIEYYDMQEKGTGGLAPLPIIKNFVRPFDLSKAPLLRVGILKTHEERYLIMVDMHHIICDGVSHGILFREFTALAAGETLPPLRLQYKDFSQWQTGKKEKENIKQQELFWMKQFAGKIPVLDLPTDYARPVIQAFEGSSEFFRLPANHTNKLKSLALEEGVTLYMILLACFNVLLSKLSSQDDIIIGTPVVGRRHIDLEKVIGMFVNTLVLRNYPNGEKNFKAFLQEVKEGTLDSFENQDYPFEDLVEKVELNRDASRNPLFDVVFMLERVEGALQEPGKEETGTGSSQEENPTGTSQFDMTLMAADSEESVSFLVIYCTRLFKRKTIKRFIAYFKKIVSSIVEEPGVRVGEIEIISLEEKEQLLLDFNNTKSDYPANETLHQLFTEQVQRTPDRTALIGQKSKSRRDQVRNPKHLEGTRGLAPLHISYKELNNKSNQLAHLLKEKGVKPDTIVGIMIERSLDMVIGILGILKAGGAYLPIDPDYPEERKQYMLKDSAAKILLTSREIADIPPTHLTHPTHPTHLCYIIYTSGSTGGPKGVMVEHRNVVRLVKNTNYIDFREGDRLLQTGALEFDASTFEIWGTLLNGLSLYLACKDIILDPGKLKEIVLKHDIATLWMTSPFFNRMSRDDLDIFAGLRNLLVGGDVLSTVHINRLKSRFPRLNVINGYGPTENTTFSTTYLIDKEYKESIPIGRPISNSTAFIVDKYNRLQPVKLTGELCVGGDGVTRGYLNNPTLTAEKFIEQVPGLGARCSWETTSNKKFLRGGPGGAVFSKSAPPGRRRQKIYKTGDLARWLPEGNIEFLGRIDHQVKIRGYRIELGEIENQLRKHEKVKEAVVITKKTSTGDNYLCAYIVTTNGEGQGRAPQVKELGTYLSTVLPQYMIPAFFVNVETLPLTSSGKVDRKALAAIKEKINAGVGPGYQPPGNPIEKILADQMQEVLETERISINDNFFQLGGHSLNAIKFVSKLKNRGIHISVNEIFLYQTIKEQARYIISTMDEDVHLIKTQEEAQQVFQEKFSSKGECVNYHIASQTYSVFYVEDAAPIKYQQILRFFRDHVTPRKCPHFIKPLSQKPETNENNIFPDNQHFTKIMKFKNDDSFLWQDKWPHLKQKLTQFNETIINNQTINQYKLSPMQLSHLAMKDRYRNIQISFDKHLDLRLLEETFLELIENQGLLRSILTEKNGELLWNEFSSPQRIAIPFVDLTDYQPEIKDKLIHRLIDHVISEAFNQNSILFRVVLFKKDLRNHLLVITIDHAIYDGMTREIIKRNLMNTYRLKEKNQHILPPKPKPYSDYIEQISIGPLDINQDELIDFFRLKEYAEAKRKFEKIILEKECRHINLLYYQFPFIEGMTEENVWEVAFFMFNLFLKRYFGLSKIPLKIVSYGRRYGQNDFFDTVGDFIDIIPVLVHVREENPAKMVEEARNKLDKASVHNINFMSISYYQSLLDKWKEAVQLIRPEKLAPNDSMINFNFVGKASEIQMSQFKSAYQGTAGKESKICTFSCEIYYTSTSLYFFISTSLTLDTPEGMKIAEKELKEIISNSGQI